jgi:hypothetical protein
LIIDALENQLMAPHLVAEFLYEFHREVNRQRQGAVLERAAANSELTVVMRKTRRSRRRDRRRLANGGAAAAT